MNSNINILIKKLQVYFYIAIFAYMISSFLSIYLPKSDINFSQEDNQILQYKKYSGFYSNVKVEVVEKKEEKRDLKVKTLDKYKLKAIYSTQENSGWISLEDEKLNKSHILSQWEEIDGYILTKLFKNHVIFEKQTVEYKLELIKNSDDKISYEISTNNELDGTKQTVLVKDDSVVITRNYLNSYINDIDKVWNSIEIKEIKKNNKIDGFKIFNIVKGSVFEKLGLKKGDIIKAVNNNILGSYSDAFRVYNNINDIKFLNIEILRNNEVMELNYEIN